MTWPGWNDDNTKETVELYLRGVSTKIAKQIGAPSRNSVIGRIHRLKIRRPGTPKRPRMAPEREDVLRLNARSVGPPVTYEPGPPEGITIMELSLTVCHWPIGGTGAEMKYCGCACEGPYCTPHAELAYVPLTAAQRRDLGRLRAWVR